MLKSTLKRAVTFLESENAQQVILPQLRERKNKVFQTWDHFKEIQTIELMDENVDTSDERAEFEDAYFDVVARFDQLIIEREPSVALEQMAVQSQQPHVSNVRLSKIELPIFSGGYKEWYAFHDTFQALIHNVATIPTFKSFIICDPRFGATPRRSYSHSKCQRKITWKHSRCSRLGTIISD